MPAQSPRDVIPARLSFFLFLFALAAHFFFLTYGTGVLIFDDQEPVAGHSETFDSLAKSMLQGRVDADPGALGNEAFHVDGKEYAYFGLLPAVLRMPLNALFPGLYGSWCRLSCFLADALILVFFMLFVLGRLGKNTVLGRERKIALFCLTFLGFSLGSPLIFLASCSYLFHESIFWGLAWSLGALHFFFVWMEDEKPRARIALGLSLCALAAMMSRVTFALPWVIIGLALALRLCVKRPFRWGPVLALVLPIAAALLLQAWYNQTRFGSPFVFMAMKGHYQLQNAVYPEFFANHSEMDLRRFPLSFFNYFLKPGGYFSWQAPWVHLDLVSVNHLYMEHSYREWVLPVPLVVPWLLVGAAAGAVKLAAVQTSRVFRFLWPAFIPQWLAVFAFFMVSQRYVLEFIPLLLYAYAFFLAGTNLSRIRVRIFAALCVFAIAVNVLGALSWTEEFNWGAPVKYREELRRMFFEINSN